MSIKRSQPQKQYGRAAKKRRPLPTSVSSMFFPSTENIDHSQKPPPLPPNKPAFKMTVDPDEETINNLISFCGGVGNPITREHAIRYLKVKSNDLNAAFEAYYSGEDVSAAEQAMTWDEAAWSQGKDGPAASGNDGTQDPHLRPLLSSAAPTRNNSPARSNMQPSSKQQEDADLAQAMAMSQGGWYPGQQTSGVVNSTGQETQFGPANRNDYDPSQWAMVPTGQASSGEILPDAEVEDRVWKAGEPRMLKHLPGQGEYLANLLTILANVHGAREALLLRDLVKRHYGEDGEWWRGHSIAMPKIVSLGDASAAGGEEDGDQYDDLLAEVQRLMAFLSASDRSYGSAGPLMQTEAIKSASTRSVRSNTMLELFMQTWGVAALAKMGAESNMDRLFTTTVGTNASEGMADTDMMLVDMPVDVSPDEHKQHDLQELMDGLLWDTSDPENSPDNYIERPAEILVMRLRQRMNSNSNTKRELKVVVPPELYLDKYMHEHIESTRATRIEMAMERKKIEKIEQIERKLRVWRNPYDGKEVDASKLVAHTLKFYKDRNAESTTNDSEEPSKHQDIHDKLQAVVASIDAKLTALTAEKEKTRAAIAAMSRAPLPGHRGPEDSQHRYILRGVATNPNITYVLAHEDDDEGGAPAYDDVDDTTYAGMRWWRLEYEVSGAAGKASKTRVGDYDVLRSVELESDRAMLVYGSMRVNTVPESSDDDDAVDLPSPLADFVKRDNELFAAERDLGRRPPPSPPAYPPREYDIAGEQGRRGSGNSTHAEDGSPPGYEDVGRFERHGSFGLPPEMKRQGREEEEEDEEDDAPVAEIRLDEEDEGVEMEERVHEPLMPRRSGQDGDVEMREGR